MMVPRFLKNMLASHPRGVGLDANAWPHLRQFLGGSLHQDADIIGGDDPNPHVFYGNIVADFCSGVGVSHRRSVLSELDAFTAQPTEISEDILRSIGADHWPSDHTPREFLALLRALLVEHLADPVAPALSARAEQ